MPRRDLRNRKNYSMLFGLYILAVLSFISLFTFLLVLFFHILVNLSWGSFIDNLPGLGMSIQLVLLSSLCALPMAVAITYLYISRSHSKIMPWFKTFMYWLVQTPILLFAVVFLYLLNSSMVSLIVGLIFLATFKLSQRWIDISSKIRLLEIQSMQSLGFSRPIIIYHLYIRRFFKKYIYHFLSVVSYLLVLVTPFLCLFHQSIEVQNYLSIDFFTSIAKDEEKTASLALFFVILHIFRSVLDQKTGYYEVEYG